MLKRFIVSFIILNNLKKNIIIFNIIYLYMYKNNILSLNKYFSKDLIFFIKIIFILLIIYFLFFYLNNSSYQEYFVSNNFNEFKYFRCDDKKIGKITGEILDKYNIQKENNNWNIYVPCGYNLVEQELMTINLNNTSNKNKKFIFGINGCDNIVSKNKIWESLVKCYGLDKASTLMPESFVLGKNIDFSKFKKKFKPTNIYILKKNIQRKEGLKLTSDYNEIINAYQENYRVAQLYLKNLYLINRRKVNLRIYLLVVCKNNKKYFYISKIGKCIYTKKEYNDDNFDFESNITSYHLDMNVYKSNPRSFEELYEYINKKEGNQFAGFNLGKKIYDLMVDVSKCISHSIFQSPNLMKSTTFQIFGADVIFDSNLHPYLLEFNKGPDMIPRDDIDKEMKTTVQEDMFKTVGLLPKDNKENVFTEIYHT